MKKIVLCICFLSIVFLFCGCTKRIDVNIYNEIDEYFVNSSSVGISLEARFDDKTPDNIELDWYTEEGTFVIEKNAQIQKLGKKVTNNGEKIYWTVDLDEDSSISTFNISLKVKDLDNGKFIANDSITIITTTEGSFKVKK